EPPTPSAPAVVTPDAKRPTIPLGVSSGDATARSAVVWCKTDRPARMFVDVSAREDFKDARRFRGPAALPETDHTAKIVLNGLSPGERHFYRVRFESLADPGVFSESVAGRFTAAPAEGKPTRDVHFVWSGDVCGQGFGIDAARGGLTMFETMRKVQPDFFLHSGDAIYADNPLAESTKLDDGSTWTNIVTPAKAKVAETLDEFRGCHAYNLLDANIRRFNAEVSSVVQWDDHETTNNWHPGEVLDDPRYTVKSCDLLSARANRAFHEYLPIAPALDPERVYRKISYGPLVDVFVLDMRSYRGANGPNDQKKRSPATAFLGGRQLEWLKRGLTRSTAVWKVVASDMPLGLIVGDGPGRFENAANGNGPPLGRELEFAELFAVLKKEKTRNVVWLTADVHYAAAHWYDPQAARFGDFDGFWEFVAGPIHAGTFGPGVLDDTFGPQLKFPSIPKGMKPNRPPSEGLQFFGSVRARATDGVLTVGLHDVAGKTLWSIDLDPGRKM
ncbi:MAG: alkaline phosphatase D family protein, partial [Planctomycetia bacterium]